MKGIVIAVPRRYERICLSNILKIRSLGCQLPVEIWESGEEISPAVRREMAGIDNLVFRRVEDHCSNPRHWKGFQIKAFILSHATFSEVMICDADIVFRQDPGVLFDDNKYAETGTYFFRDLEKWQFTKLNNRMIQLKQKLFYDKFTSAAFYSRRKRWLTGVLPEKSHLFPAEWEYIYSPELPERPVKEALQESGVVLMNRELHRDSIENIYKLNDNHKETYRFIWGDKETYWIGCVMAGKPFFFNPSSGYISSGTGLLTHDYNGKPFFSQKG